ncbi:MAG: hypothetical protein HC772_12560 [Leptolyngbyaceae cyanobacterium CRU_2_3]|nr:hypothetical protein [Leptolyngbyaceae cyanobacterium CRU_2_3]
MTQENCSIFFWSGLLCLMTGTIVGLSDRYLLGKPISPLDGFMAGTGAVGLMFLHAKIEASED